MAYDISLFMKTLSLFFVLFLMTQSAFAQECFSNEINPRTNKIFSSAEVYQGVVQDWLSREPESPGIFTLARAYSIYKKEQAAAQALGNDKRAHCYMGCRISQGTNYRTSEYVGWMKEDRDIKDCKKGTRFEYADFDATVVGGQFGQSQVDATGCVSICKQNY